MYNPGEQYLLDARLDELERAVERAQQEAAALRLRKHMPAAHLCSAPRRWAAACLIRAGRSVTALGALVYGDYTPAEGAYRLDARPRRDVP